MKAKLILAFATCLIAATAQAQWVKAGNLDDDSPFYVDPVKIKRSGDIAKIWVLIDYKTPTKSQLGSGIAASTMQQYVVKCNDEMVGMAYVTQHSKKQAQGKLLGSQIVNYPEFSPAGPGSVGEIFHKIACA